VVKRRASFERFKYSAKKQPTKKRGGVQPNTTFILLHTTEKVRKRSQRKGKNGAAERIFNRVRTWMLSLQTGGEKSDPGQNQEKI